jgi:hypothetical protein
MTPDDIVNGGVEGAIEFMRRNAGLVIVSLMDLALYSQDESVRADVSKYLADKLPESSRRILVEIPPCARSTVSLRKKEEKQHESPHPDHSRGRRVRRPR